MSLLKVSKHTFWAPAEPAPKRCIFRICLKTFSWKSKMKNVVKYCVYQDILLRVSIYVTTCQFFKENPQMDFPVIWLREQSAFNNQRGQRRTGNVGFLGSGRWDTPPLMQSINRSLLSVSTIDLLVKSKYTLMTRRHIWPLLARPRVLAPAKKLAAALTDFGQPK